MMSCVNVTLPPNSCPDQMSLWLIGVNCSETSDNLTQLSTISLTLPPANFLATRKFLMCLKYREKNKCNQITMKNH